MVVYIHHLRITVAAGFLLVGTGAHRIGNAASFQVMQGEAFLWCDGAVRYRQCNKPLPSGIETGAGEIAAHVHGPSPVPTTAAAFTEDSMAAAALSGPLKAVTL